MGPGRVQPLGKERHHMEWFVPTAAHERALNTHGITALNKE